MIQATGLNKIRDGVYESTDDDGYREYILKRNTTKEISALKSQINNINDDISDIKQMLQQLIKVQ